MATRRDHRRASRSPLGSQPNHSRSSACPKAMIARNPTEAAPTAGRPARPGWRPDVDPARCTGCGWCVAACDLHLLSLEVVEWKKYATLGAADLCTGCSDCAVKCPFHAISMRRVAP